MNLPSGSCLGSLRDPIPGWLWMNTQRDLPSVFINCSKGKRGRGVPPDPNPAPGTASPSNRQSWVPLATFLKAGRGRMILEEVKDYFWNLTTFQITWLETNLQDHINCTVVQSFCYGQTSSHVDVFWHILYAYTVMLLRPNFLHQFIRVQYIPCSSHKQY